MNDPANSSDEELADSLSNSNGQSIAILADRYARSLYDFALRLTLDIEAAATVVKAAFEDLQSQAARRSAQTTVRAMLFNAALEQGLDMADSRVRPASGRLATGDRRFTQVEAGIDREAALWAWQAARSLRPRDYAVVDLTVRRGLGPEALSETATQGRSGIVSILDRAQSAFAEAYVATALYFRGRDACDGLSELVGGSGAAMRVGIRRQIVSHAEDCVTCQATLQTLPSAADVFAALLDVDPPAELPGQVAASSAAVAAAAAGQLTLDDAAVAGEADAVEPGESQDGFTPDEPEEPATDTAFDERDEGQNDPEEAPPASEEVLWARPEGEAGFAGVASTELPPAPPDVEERSPVEPFEPPYRPAEAFEQPVSGYAAEQPAYAGYAPARLTLRDRLAIWFEPGYDGRFAWSYAVLGAATAVAVLIGLFVAASLAGGGDDSPAIGPDLVREIACETGPMSLQAGARRTFEFDPGGLDGFELQRVVVARKPATASQEALVVSVGGATVLTARAAPVISPTARSDDYGLQIVWQRGDEDAVTDCPLTVSVAASTPGTPGPAVTPAAAETPAPTP